MESSAINGISRRLYEATSSAISAHIEACKADYDNMAKKSGEEVVNAVTKFAEAVNTIAKGTRVDGTSYVSMVSRVSVEAGGGITILVRTHVHEEVEHRCYVRSNAKNPDCIQKLANGLLAARVDQLNKKFATKNVEALNAVLVDCVEQAEVPFGIEFVVGTSSGLADITNDKVVLGISVQNAIILGDCAIMRAEDSNEYDQFMRKEAINKLVAELRGIQSPVLFVATKIVAFKKFYPTTRKRVDKQIRGVVHRKVENLKNIKAGLGYYAENGVFALVEKKESGEYVVVLNPFDTETNAYVDMDVLSAIQ